MLVLYLVILLLSVSLVLKLRKFVLGNKTVTRTPNQKEPVEKFPKFPSHEVPVVVDSTTGERRVQSFEPHQVKEYLEFFETFGFVVIDNVFSKQEVKNSIEDIWSFIEMNHEEDEELRQRKQDMQNFFRKQYKTDFIPVDRRNPSTWNPENGWPAGETRGLLGNHPVFSSQSLSNRQSPILYDICKNLYSTVLPPGEAYKLWISFDRYGVMRPTSNIPVPYTYFDDPAATATSHEFNMITEAPKWKTQSSWLHYDTNPWLLHEAETSAVPRKTIADGRTIELLSSTDQYFLMEGNDYYDCPLKIQGLMNFIDGREQDGGFLTVPGFSNNHFSSWAEQTKNFSYRKKFDSLHYVPIKSTSSSGGETDPMNEQTVKVNVKSGSVLLWNSKQPHCNYDNKGDRFRMVQYFKVFPSREYDKTYTTLRRSVLTQKLPSKFVANSLSPLGKQFLGLEDYA